MSPEMRETMLAKLDRCTHALEYAAKWKAKQGVIMGEVVGVLNEVKAEIVADQQGLTGAN